VERIENMDERGISPAPGRRDIEIYRTDSRRESDRVSAGLDHAGISHTRFMVTAGGIEVPMSAAPQSEPGGFWVIRTREKDAEAAFVLTLRIPREPVGPDHRRGAVGADYDKERTVRDGLWSFNEHNGVRRGFRIVAAILVMLFAFVAVRKIFALMAA
jgi:hypothetical protein